MAGRVLAGPDQEQRAVRDALERLDVDVTQTARTGHHAVDTSDA